MDGPEDKLLSSMAQEVNIAWLELQNAYYTLWHVLSLGHCP